jgi:RND family efflux transporter MFP subunit
MAEPESPRIRILWILTALVACGLVAWQLGTRFGLGLLTSTARQQPVTFVRITQGPVRDVIIAKGTISYPKQITLRAQSNGQLASLTVTEGSSVTIGQTVAELVNPQDQIDRQSLDVDIQRAQARRDALGREIADMRRLLAVGGLARHELEQKELELNLATKDAERVRVDTVKLAERQRHARHISPLSGVVLAVPVTQGQWLNAGDELMTLAGGAGPNITVQIDAMDLERIQVGQLAVFSAREDGGTRRSGRIQEISRAVSAGQRQNTVKVTIAPSESLGELRVAQQLYVEIVVLDETSVMRLPKEYLYRQGSQVLAQVLTAHGIESRQVQTRPGDTTYDIVVGGLGLEDRVVLPTAGALAKP